MTTLGESLTLPCGQILRNRTMKAALSEALGDRTHGPSTRLETLYGRWGSGGFGLLITGNVMVDRSQIAEPGNVVVDDDRDAEALTAWAKTAKNGGAEIWMQLNHPGRQSNPIASRGRPVAPSAIALKIPGMATPRELSTAEIEEIVDKFAETARVAESSGFGGVQIHAAHGYLVAQFLSPLSNQRTDEWGGDPERRRRFLIEIVRRIRSTVAPGFAVSVKLNSADFQRGGFSEDESREVVRALTEESVDLIEISGGSYESPAMMGKVQKQSTRDREAYFLEYAETVRAIAGDIPLAVTGGFRSRSAMVEALASGACDVIGLGRPTITIPDAATVLLESNRERLNVPIVEFGARKLLGKVADISMLDGALDLQWHTDQLHRMGDGSEPDPARPWWKTLGTMVRRNGIDALRPTKRAA